MGEVAQHVVQIRSQVEHDPTETQCPATLGGQSEMSIVQYGRRPREVSADETISEAAREVQLGTIRVDRDHLMTGVANLGAVAQSQQRLSTMRLAYQLCGEAHERCLMCRSSS